MSITLKAMPFDSKEILDEVTGEASFDRVAYSKDLADWLRTYFSNGILVQGGDTLGEELKVIHKEGLTVAIKPGAVCINGRTGWNDVEQTLTVNIGKEEPRIDMIVAELNIPNDRGIYIKLIEGISAASPQKPNLTQNEDVYQIPLASLQIEAGSARVGSVVDERQGNISNVTIGIKPPTGNDAVAVKLSDSIKNKFKLSDNANVEDALAVVSDEEYILNCYDTSGEITLPSDAVHNEVDVVCVAGGGGGFRINLNNQYASDGRGYGGARGGYVHHKIIVGDKKTAKIFIGAGGKGNLYYRNQAKGGTTVFQCTEAVVAICDYNKDSPDFAGVISKANLPIINGVVESGIPGMGNIAGQAVFVPSGKPMPIILPTKEISTYPGEANGDGKNATEYGCGGNSGTNSISGGDGKQGCVYIGYWRKRG